jgi:hypothetical protein
LVKEVGGNAAPLSHVSKPALKKCKRGGQSAEPGTCDDQGRNPIAEDAFPRFEERRHCIYCGPFNDVKKDFRATTLAEAFRSVNKDFVPNAQSFTYNFPNAGRAV